MGQKTAQWDWFKLVLFGVETQMFTLTFPHATHSCLGHSCLRKQYLFWETRLKWGIDNNHCSECGIGGGAGAQGSDQTTTGLGPKAARKWQDMKAADTPDHAGIYVVSDFHVFSKDLQSSDKFILGLWLMLWLVRHRWEWLLLSCCLLQFVVY